VLYSAPRDEKVELWLYSLITTVLHMDEWSAARPDRLNPGKGPCASSVRCCVGHRGGLDASNERIISHFCRESKNSSSIS